VQDAGQSSKGFVDGAASNGEYHYDVNGNLIKDDNKQIAIAYNHLNLPKQINFAQHNAQIDWLYTATGQKVQKKVTAPNTPTSYKHYIGKVQYVDGTIEFIQHQEGRIVREQTGVTADNEPIYAYSYEYCLKDHLGNSRVFFSDLDKDGMVEVTQGGSPNELLQQAHYYPFGMELEGQWAYVQPQIGKVNEYLYNGKELNADFGLGWSDYGARWYDASIGRWNGVDALAAKYSALSPYNYVANNPLKFVDPDGMRVEGDYYSANGSYLGSDGKKDDKVYVATSVTKNDNGVVVGAVGSSLLMDQDGQYMSHNEFLKISATIFGEASTEGGANDNGRKESFGIASTIRNRMRLKNKSAIEVIKKKADAYGGRKYKRFINAGIEGRESNQRMKDALAGVINALTNGYDYSLGATGWDGRDLLVVGHSHNRYEEYNGRQGLFLPSGAYNDAVKYIRNVRNHYSNRNEPPRVELWAKRNFDKSRYVVTTSHGQTLFHRASKRSRLVGKPSNQRVISKK
jgi:RHS repeat-associated protein